MSAENLEVGDVVRLKSGGPRMTIQEFPINEGTGRPEEGIVTCVWFKEFEVLRDNFPLVVLEFSVS